MVNLILNSLEIRRFRAFEHLQVERLGRVNLIVGKNNVGKTCLLEAIQLYARSGSPALIAELLGSRDESRLSNLDSVAINFLDLLPGLKYLFFGRRELTNFLETIHIGPVNTPDKTLIITIGGFSSYNTVDDQGPRFSIHMGKKQLVNFSLNSSTYPRLLLTEIKGTTCVSIQAGGLSSRQIGELWDDIALTTLEQEVRTALQIIAPGTEGISVVGDPASAQGRIPIVKIKNIDEPLPLRSLGDGMQRMFGIALALVNARNGILLIDEIENGIHYSVQPDLWHLIFRLAHQLNAQVFATTHSWDCLKGFQEAAQEDNREGLLIRLENKKGIHNLLTTLNDELIRSGLERLGIVVDADTDLAARWQSLRDKLIRSGYSAVPAIPDANGSIIEQVEQPTVGVWLMPDNRVPEMLEDFISFLVPQGDVLWPLAEGILQRVIETDCRFPLTQTIKAHLHTWLSWQEEPGKPMGQAITKRYLKAEAPHAQQLMAWIHQLFNLEPTKT